MAGTLPWEEMASCPPLAPLWLGRWGSPRPGPIWLGWASSASSHWLVSSGPAFVQLEQDRWGLGSCGPVLGPGQLPPGCGWTGDPRSGWALSGGPASGVQTEARALCSEIADSLWAPGAGLRVGLGEGSHSLSTIVPACSTRAHPVPWRVQIWRLRLREVKGWAQSSS